MPSKSLQAPCGSSEKMKYVEYFFDCQKFTLSLPSLLSIFVWSDRPTWDDKVGSDLTSLVVSEVKYFWGRKFGQFC